MAAKLVRVEVKVGEKFKMECRAGKHLVIVDQPVEGGGSDAGPTPLDIQLMALGSCITTIGRIVAMQRRLAVRGITVALEAELDTDGLLGKPTRERVGFKAIKAAVRVEGDLSVAEKTKFLHDVDARCPISDILKNAVPVSVSLAT